MESTPRRQRTHDRLVACALDLYESQGFEQTTVAQIAAAAGVTQMTFFRHFSSKELVVIDDPYDPAIVAAIAARPISEPALRRAAAGVGDAFGQISAPESELVRRRVRIVANSAALRAASVRGNEATESRVRDELVTGGAPPLVARAAAAALLAALRAALFEWANDERLSLAAAIRTALGTLEGQDA